MIFARKRVFVCKKVPTKKNLFLDEKESPEEIE
jgi:hypothetical protein